MTRTPTDVSTLFDYIENPGRLAENAEPVHVPTVPYGSVRRARAAYEPLTELESRWAASPFFERLDGEWAFCWARSPSEVPERLADDDAWDEIAVPLPWQLAGYDRPIYRNHALTWEDIPELSDEPDPPTVPREFNPVGTYRREFSVPEAWAGDRRTYLHFEGVKSAFFVWIDDEYVGYDQGSMTPTEFDLTGHVAAGEDHTLTVQVVRFSDGSFLETQDMLRFSGIFRSVHLYSKPETAVRDYAVRTDLDDAYADGRLTVEADVRAGGGGDDDGRDATLVGHLYDPDGERVRTVEADVEADGPTTLHADVPGVETWSAERPTLYTLVLELTANDETLEALPTHVGFRTYEVTDGRLRVNGRPVTFRGVNRHEHDPETGRTVSAERVREEFALMKRNNVNAVRAAHYPNDPTMYALADEMGLYVVDEANVETHFDLSFVNDYPAFHESFVERFRRMVDHHRNFTCIVLWSTSNEAGTGPAHEEMAEYAHASDDTRFVYHQGSGEAPYEEYHDMMTGTAPFTDVSGPRYPVPNTLAQHSALDDRPLVMGEYAHALCNSLGHQEAYWGLIDRIDRLQGGFVWEWANQTLRGDALPLDGDDEHWFADSPFLLDGLVFADLTPAPTLAQVKKTQQPFTVDPVEPTAGIATVTNRHHFTDLSAYDVTWELSADGDVVQQGVIDAQVEPGQTRGLIVPFDPPDDPGAAEWYVTVRLRLAEDTTWASAGHSLGFAQFPVPFEAGDAAADGGVAPVAAGVSPTVERDGDEVVVAGERFRHVFDADRGTFARLTYGGETLVADGPCFDAYRAATPNEGHVAVEWGYDARAEWDAVGLDDLRYDVRECTVTTGTPVRIDVDATASNREGAALFGVRYAYAIDAAGGVDVEVSVDPTDRLSDALTTWLPRIGVDVDLPAALTEMEWFGRGPGENYPDRRIGAAVGRYDVPLADQFVPYRIPEDNANKCDVRWAAFTGASDAGLLVVGDPTLNVRPDGFENTADAERLGDLVPRDGTRLSLDAAVSGVGGTPHKPLDDYRVAPEPTSFAFTLRPYDATVDGPTLARDVSNRRP